MAYISILLAFIIGYYIGNRRQLKQDTEHIKRKITEAYDSVINSKEIKIIAKKEPNGEIAEISAKLEKKDSL